MLDFFKTLIECFGFVLFSLQQVINEQQTYIFADLYLLCLNLNILITLFLFKGGGYSATSGADLKESTKKTLEERTRLVHSLALTNGGKEMQLYV